MHDLFRELRLSLRAARGSPVFTLVAVVTLALAIGGTTAIAGFVRAILLAPLPYPDPDALVVVTRSNPAQGFEGLYASSEDAVALMERSESFERISAVHFEEVTLSGGERPERVRAARALPDLLPLLGIEPALGRGFLPEEAEDAAILGHGLWRSRFGGRSDVLGEVLRHDGKTATIVGVLPEGAAIALREADVWLPMSPARLREPDSLSLKVFARLGRGATRHTAEAELAALARRLEEERAPPVRGWGLDVTTVRTELVGDVESMLWVLQAAVALALLVACVNFAGLLLARGATREREIAVRRALGAGQWRIVRLLLTESIFLSLLGGIVGLALARWMTELFLALAPPGLPRWADVVVDGKLFGLAFALAALSGILAGAIPALALSRAQPERSLRASSPTAPAVGPRRLRDVLTVAQFAAALVLTVVTGLLMQSFVRLIEVEPGFEPTGLLSARLSFPEHRYPAPSHRTAVLPELLERIEALPDVESAAASGWTPMTGSWSRAQMSIEDLGGSTDERSRWPMVLDVTPRFFRTMGIPLLQGRFFAREDEGRGVVVVSRLLAERAWPGATALGRRIKFGGTDSENPWLEVVGVVEDARLVGVSIAEEEVMFRPLLPLQSTLPSLSLLVRSASDTRRLVPALRAAVREVDEEMPLEEIRTMDALLGTHLSSPRFQLSVLGAFTALAVGLAGLGIYGVVANWAGSRHREIGVRMALGANRASVIRLVLGQGAVLVALGLFLGTVASVALGRLLSATLYETSPSDPMALLTASLFLGGIGVGAAFIPALRAAARDPGPALKAD